MDWQNIPPGTIFYFQRMRHNPLVSTVQVFMVDKGDLKIITQAVANLLGKVVLYPESAYCVFELSEKEERKLFPFVTANARGVWI